MIEAIDSCFASKLPNKTEFVIVDNNSTDGTKDAVYAYFMQNEYFQYDLHYEYEETNLGVGGGRNRGFHLAQGKYLYFLDDDAVISEECNKTFFVSAIAYFEKNASVASITTRIKDLAWQSDRIPCVSLNKRKIDGRDVIFRYAGGSHFLRKSVFEDPLYFQIQYGNEEELPSILVQDHGFCHVYFDDIYIVHKPKVNKWTVGSDTNEKISQQCIAVGYATRLIIYPCIFKPILKLAYHRRRTLHLSSEDSKNKCDEIVMDLIKYNKHTKIGIRTVIKLYKEFGLTVF